MPIAENELSERELEILRLISTGVSNKEIAQDLHISVNTVKVHVRNIFSKIGVNSRTEAAMYAVNAGMISPASAAVNEPEPFAGTTPEAGSTAGVDAADLPSGPAPRRWSVFAVLLAAALLGGLAWLAYRSGLFPLNRSAEGGGESPGSAAEIQTWNELAPLPTARYGLAAVTDQDMIYAIGGFAENGPTGVQERYRVTSSTWEQIAPKPEAAYDIGAVLLGGKIYVPGGRTSDDHVISSLEIYDPSSDTWSRGADLPEPRSAYALASFEGQLYLFGGWDGEKFRDTIYNYNPILDQWSDAGQLPSPRGYASAANATGRILVFGGFDGSSALSDTLAYKPGADKSTLLSSQENMPAGRFGMGAASFGDVVLIIGGASAQGEVPDSWEYFGLNNDWQAFQKPASETLTDLAVVPNGLHLFAMGGRLDGEPTNQFVSYQAFYSVVFPIIK